MVASNNNYLSKLTPSAGTLSPELSHDKDAYSFKVVYESTSASVTVKAEDDNAQVSIDNSEYFSTATADKTFTFTGLEVGNNEKTIYVKAQNNEVKSYSVNIIRQSELPSDDNTLSALSITHGTKTYALDKVFAAGTTEYEITEDIEYTIESLTVNATANHALATIKYFVDTTEQATNEVITPKAKGSKYIIVRVTAENEDTKDYKVKYTKNPSSNAYLSNIVDSASKITDFVKTTTEYTVTVDKDTESITLNLTAEDAKSTISIGEVSGVSTLEFTKSDLVTGNNEITIIVTAEDETTKETYTVTVVRESDEEFITSEEYKHVIADKMIKTVKLNTTVLELKNQLDNDNSKLEVWTPGPNGSIDGGTKLSDGDKVATGYIVKLIVNGELKDYDFIVVKGDTNGDGKITLLDAVKTINHYLKKSTMTGAYFEAADTTSDGKITLLDAVKIINHYLKRTSLFD